MTTPLPEFWLVSTARAGHVNQCSALLSELGALPARHIEIIGKSATDPLWKKILMYFVTWSQTLAALLRHPIPRRAVIVCSGRSIIWLCRIWRLLARNPAFVIYLGTPNSSLTFADLLVRSEHERNDLRRSRTRRFAVPKHEIFVKGVLCEKWPHYGAKNGKQKRLAVLIGGRNNTFSYDGRSFLAFLERIACIARQGDWLVDFIFSRRTQSHIVDVVSRVLGKSEVNLIASSDRERFRSSVQLAAMFVAGPDSVTMVSECCNSGRPVFVMELENAAPGSDISNFVDRFINEKFILPFSNFPDASDAVAFPDQRKRVAQEIFSLVHNWQKSHFNS